MEIKGFLPLSLIDYPGKMAAVIFLPGCNFRCTFCFNIDLVLHPEALESLDADHILKELKARKKWIDGVVITGGEPTLSNGLEEFIEKVKKLGFPVKLDTNGSNPKMLKNLIEKKLIDYVAMDIKCPLEKYSKATGVDANINDIKESVDIIRNSGIDYEFRTTVVPSLIKKKDVEEIGKWLKGSKRYFLQQFRSKKTLDAKHKNEKPYTAEELEKLAEVAREFFGECQVRNV